jgi:PhnB protein
MRMNPYINLNGNCAEALKFYERVLGAKITFTMSYADSPMAQQTPPNWLNKVMHASLVVGDAVLMASDGPPDKPSEIKGCSLSLSTSDPAEAERIFNALSEKGKVHMALQETFWAYRFAMFVDQFGVPWMINCEKPLDPSRK